jgi:hypothetical protein
VGPAQIGIETIEDLLEDLDQALAASQVAAGRRGHYIHALQHIINAPMHA